MLVIYLYCLKILGDYMRDMKVTIHAPQFSLAVPLGWSV